MKYKEVINEHMFEYCHLNNIPFPVSLQQVQPTLHAGYTSFFKYNKQQPEYDASLWDATLEWAKRHFSVAMRGSSVLSQDDVIQELDFSSSCGFPWSRKYFTKRDFLDSPDAVAIQDYWDTMLEAIPPIWTCAQKRELREVAKVEAKKHRTFTASPIEFTIATNRLCLDMNNKLYSNGLLTWSFVGNSKFYRGWNSLYHYLSNEGVNENNAYELDESEYDSSIFCNALWDMVDLRFSMLKRCEQTPDNYKRFEKLYEAIINSYVVLEDGHIVRKFTGNPSGSANTIVDNTIILYRLFVYAWFKFCDTHDINTDYSHFHSNVRAALNGDDNTYTTTPEFVSFNPAFIQSIWATIGVTAKSPSLEPRHLSSVSFLSNEFTWDSRYDLWLPKLSYDKLMCSLALGSQYEDVRWHLLRAYALRIEGYTNKAFFSFVEDFIEYLHTVHKHELVGSFFLSSSKISISMETIESMRLTEKQLDYLYLGFESKGLIKEPALLKLPHNIQYTLRNDLQFQSLNMTKGKNKHHKKAIKQAIRAEIKHAEKKARRPAKKKTHQGGIIRELSSAVGSFTGMPTVARKVGNFISKVTGQGDYTVQQNSFCSSPNMVPSFSNGGDDITITHTEYVTDVNSSLNFAYRSWDINPMDRSLFPWLSGIAMNYEMYKFDGLLFQFKSTSADALNSTNTALGTVIMTTQYDLSKAPFSNKMECENYEFCVSTKPSESALHPVECKPSSEPFKWRYVEDPAVVPGTQTGIDANLLNYGRFQLSTVGMQAISNIGELWVTYKVRFTKPRIPGFGSNQNQQVYSSKGNTLLLSTGNYQKLFVQSNPNDDPHGPPSGLPWYPNYYVSSNPDGAPKPIESVGGSQPFFDLSSCAPGSCWQFSLIVYSDIVTNIQMSDYGKLISESGCHGCSIVPYFNNGIQYYKWQSVAGINSLWTSVVIQVGDGSTSGSFALLNSVLGTSVTSSNNANANMYVQQVPYRDNWFSPTSISETDLVRSKVLALLTSDENKSESKEQELSRESSDCEVVPELQQSLHIDASTLSKLLTRK